MYLSNGELSFQAWIHSYTQDGGDNGVTTIDAATSEKLLGNPIPPLAIPNAVNSVGKTPKKTKDPLVNGHAEGKSDTSSSEHETRKSPAKRKAKVKKKKKAGKRVVDESTNVNNKKKKTAAASAVVSATPGATESSESERETGSDKDSDSGSSKRSGNAKEPKKRGRRPKGAKNDADDEPRSKKAKEDASKPFRKAPVAVLKKTGETFLQDGPCFEVAPKLGKCRECRWTPNQRSKTMPNIFCRFYAFRRLRYTKNGQLAIAGFSDPHADPTEVSFLYS